MVHVWCSNLVRQTARIESLSQILSADEIKRAGRFYYLQDRDKFIIARGTLRNILGRYLKMCPEEIRFRYGPFGKPELSYEVFRMEPLCFSVSHSHGLALFAVTRNRRVGVDIEHICQGLAIKDIARHFFTRQENIELESYPKGKQKKGFFALWTRKEAYLKAIGTGIGIAGIRHGQETDSRWSFTSLRVAKGYAAAIASEGSDLTFQCLQWTGSTD